MKTSGGTYDRVAVNGGAFKRVPAGGRKPPKELEQLLEKTEAILDEEVDSDPRYNLRRLEHEIQNFSDKLEKGIGRRKEMLCKKKDLVWSLTHRREVVFFNVILSDYQTLVHSLKWDDNGGWDALVWCSNDELAIVGLEDELPSTMLTQQGFKRLRQHFSKTRNGDFVPIGRYERRSMLDETHFRSAKMLPDGSVQLMDINGLAVTVGMDWARRSLPPDAVSELRRGMDTSHPLPLGSKPRATGGAVYQNHQMPSVVYQNRGDRCLTTAMASGLHYLGFTNEAHSIALSSDSGTVTNDSTQFRSFADFVKSVFTTRRVFYRKPVQRKTKGCKERVRYDPLDPKHRRKNPVVLSLRAKLGGSVTDIYVNHCVCIVGDHLFDPNHQNAMPLSRESLDYSCSSVVSGSVYSGYYWCRELAIH